MLKKCYWWCFGQTILTECNPTSLDSSSRSKYSLSHVKVNTLCNVAIWYPTSYFSVCLFVWLFVCFVQFIILRRKFWAPITYFGGSSLRFICHQSILICSSIEINIRRVITAINTLMTPFIDWILEMMQIITVDYGNVGSSLFGMLGSWNRLNTPTNC